MKISVTNRVQFMSERAFPGLKYYRLFRPVFLSIRQEIKGIGHKNMDYPIAVSIFENYGTI